jgi:hypothetical protein
LVRVLAPATAQATAPPPPLQRAWVHACCALWSQQQEQLSGASASGDDTGAGEGEGMGGEGAGAGAAMEEGGALPHTLVDVAYGDLRK